MSLLVRSPDEGEGSRGSRASRLPLRPPVVVGSSPNANNYELVELCTPVNQHIEAYPAQTEAEAPEILISSGEMRSDGGSQDINVAYRLRSYNTTAAAGNGEGTFYIEGIVSRGDTVMARALLRRSLYVSSKVAGAGDWSVLSGHNLRLNETEINGPGNIFYLTHTPDHYLASQYAGSCSDVALLADVDWQQWLLVKPRQSSLANQYQRPKTG